MRIFACTIATLVVLITTTPTAFASENDESDNHCTIGGGVGFWGGARSGGGLFFGVSPLALDCEFGRFVFGAHLMWAGDGDVDLGIHPGATLYEYHYSNQTTTSIKVTAAMVVEHEDDGGWNIGVGGGVGSDTCWGRFCIGAEMLLLGFTGTEHADWSLGYEIVLVPAAYRFF